MSLKASLLAAARLPGFALNGIAYHLAGSLYTPKPRFVCLPVTFRCNSRCQMCSIWQNPATTEELTLDQLRAVLGRPVFRRVEDVVLHGGEPTLRKDIADIYGILMSSCPRLKTVTLSTNGLSPRAVDARLSEILSAENSRRVGLIFSVSLDGLRTSHDRIRGVEGAFERAVETLGILKKYREKYPIGVEIITVIQPQNLGDLDGLLALAKENGVELIFQPLLIDPFYGNTAGDPRLRFSDEERRTSLRFIETRLAVPKTARGLYWRNYLEMMDGGRRTIPCAYDRYVLSLFPDGEVLPCSRAPWIRFGNIKDADIESIWFGRGAGEVRRRMKREVCPTCSFYCGAEYSLQKEFFTYLAQRTKGVLRRRSGGDADRTA